MSFEDNIKKLNIILPNAPAPVGSYVATKIVGKFLYISGQVSINEKGEFIKGKVGKDLTKGFTFEWLLIKSKIKSENNPVWLKGSFFCLKNILFKSTYNNWHKSSKYKRKE